MKLGILFNCQHGLLASAARHLLPDAEVVDFDVGPLFTDEALRDRVLEELAGCDHVLSLQLEAWRGPLAPEALHARLRRLTLLPFLTFGGFHPDMVYVHTAALGYLEGYTHHYHSRIAIAGFLSGRTARETAGLYNALVMGRAGYYDVYAQEQVLACQLFERFGIELAPMFQRWRSRGVFMHSINHPKGWCFADIGVALLRYAGLLGDGTMDSDALARALGDPLAVQPTHPVLPPLARRLGVPAEVGFKAYQAETKLALLPFVDAEYERFSHAGRPELEAVPGVAALAAMMA